MIDLFQMSFVAITISALTCFVLREIFLATLPAGGFFPAQPRA